MPRLRIPITKKIRDEALAFVSQLRAEGVDVVAVEFAENGVRILTNRIDVEAKDDKAARDEARRKIIEGAERIAKEWRESASRRSK